MDGYAELQTWSGTPLGDAFLTTEKQLLKEAIAHQFGFHLVFSGEISCFTLLQDSPILHRVILTPTPLHHLNSLCTRLDKLPFLTESLDLLILQHTLESLWDPHSLLQEAARVLLPEGRLVIFLFNPISAWGLLRVFKRKSASFPWNLRFYSRKRVINWLKALGFAEIEVEYFFNRPPVNKVYFLSKLMPLERPRCFRWLGMGGGYRIVAKKRQACVTPTQIFAPAKRRLVITGLAPSG